MTRLLREHPAIEVEMDAEGTIRAIGWNARREVVAGLQIAPNDEALQALLKKVAKAK